MKPEKQNHLHKEMIVLQTATNVHMESTRAKARPKIVLASVTKMRDVTTVTQFMLTFSLHEEL